MARPEYTQWDSLLVQTSNAWLTPLNLAAATGNYAACAIMTPLALNRLSFLVTTAVTSGSVAGQVAFKRYPTYNSSAGSVAIGTLTIPNAASVGQVYYKDVGYTKLNAGEQLQILIGTQAVDSGTAAGAGYVGFSYEPAPDSTGNQTNMVASA